MDQAKQKAGPAESLSHAEKQANKRRTHKVRRQFDESYLNPDGTKSALVTGSGLEPGQWMDPIGTIHEADDNPLNAYE